MEKYPGDMFLKLGYDSFKHREECLLVELRESYERFQIDTFDFVIDGDVVRDHRVSLQFLGSFSNALQDVVSTMSYSLLPNSTGRNRAHREISAASQMDLVATATGSFRIILSSHDPQLGDSISKQSLQIFNKLVDCEDDKEKIKQISREVGIKPMKKYQKLMEVIFKSSASIKMYDLVSPEGFNTKFIASDLAERIYNAINEAEELPVETVIHRGRLTGVNVRSCKFEFIMEETHTIINGKFSSSLAEEAKRNLNTSTSIQFNVTTVYDDILAEVKKDWEIKAFVNE
jgi:hypothetical protein